MKGKLTIFLGYAAGVGKTYQMLEQAQVLAAKGVDLVIGYFEPHARKDTIAKTEGLEMIPRRRIEYRGTVLEEMDFPAIVARKPQVCVVDEFPHTNAPGVENEKRWQDVLALLEHGIDVLTTMNIQHLECLNDQMQKITRVRVRETIPDWVMKEADEVVMVDVPPRALLNRLERGVVYAPDKAAAARQNFFQETTLVALREMALRQTAHEVDIRQAVPDGFGPGYATDQSRREDKGPEERILIYINSDPQAAALIRRARRVAEYLQAQCFAVAIVPTGYVPDQDSALQKHLSFARNLRIATETLEEANPAGAVVEFARKTKITQIYLAKSEQESWVPGWRRTETQEIVRLARDMRVVIVSDRTR
ncbi:MAG: histidine kinase [Bryobacteraceae bacterium]|nr:histidine kinase [Bryobacteraceae bacterium]